MNNKMPPSTKKNTSGGNNEQVTASNPVKASNTANKQDIMQLPLRKIMAGDTLYQGYYDEQHLILYLADDNGNLIGRKAALPKPLPPVRQDVVEYQEGVDERRENPVLTEVSDNVKHMMQKVHNNKQTAHSDKSKRDKHMSKRVAKIAIIIFAVIVALIIAVWAGFRLSISLLANNQITEVPVPKEGEIMVIEVKKDILPGDIIDEDNLQAANINSQTYNQIAINGNDLYRWEQKDNIIGMYASEYISQGHYVTTNSVTKIYKGHTNPWGNTNSSLDYADIPIDIAEYDRTKLLIGNKVNLKFQISRKEENSSGSLPTTAEAVKVMQEDNVTTTRSYEVSNVVIANILTANNDDLFEVYSALSAIPEGNQENYIKKAVKYNKEYIYSITPAKIRVVFDKEYISELSKAISNGVKVDVELTDDADTSTTEKKDFYNSEKLLMESISQVIK